MMNKSTTIITFLLLFLFACQKEASKQTTADLGTQIPGKQITFLRTDTTTHVNKSYSLDTSKIKVHINGLFSSDPIPEASLGITYEGSGVYHIQPYNNQGEYSYDCAYAIYKNEGSYSVLFENLGENTGIQASQSYTGGLSVGSYYLVVTYFTGPIGDSDGSSTEQVPFTIYAQPVAPGGMICLFRYFDKISGQHICTSNWEELGSYSENFEYEKVIGYMYPASTTGSNLQPLYRYYDATTGSHYTTNIYGTYSSFVYEGILGSVGIASSGNLVNPIDKWYDAASYDHFNCVPPEVPNGTAYTKDANFICGYVQ